MCVYKLEQLSPLYKPLFLAHQRYCYYCFFSLHRMHLLKAKITPINILKNAAATVCALILDASKTIKLASCNCFYHSNVRIERIYTVSKQQRKGLKRTFWRVKPYKLSYSPLFFLDFTCPWAIASLIESVNVPCIDQLWCNTSFTSK